VSALAAMRSTGVTRIVAVGGDAVLGEQSCQLAC
jgi:hypothetical protein